MFDAFEESGCFGLKVLYMNQGDQVRVDYVLTLSCYQIHKVSEREEKKVSENILSELYEELDDKKNRFVSPIQMHQVKPVETTVSANKSSPKFFTF